jgi:coupling of ubiquitin conjugation to ER degradation protein 1
MTETETTLNIPQLAFLFVIGFLAIRWIFSPRPDQAGDVTVSSSRSAGTRANPHHVDTITQMFPQLDRRAIMWDLQRNGNNVQLTTDRILAGRGLETVSHLDKAPPATKANQV